MKRSGEGEQRNSSANLVGGGVLDAPQSQFNATSLSDRLRGYPPRAKPELAKQGATRGARRSTPTTTVWGGDLRLWDDPSIVEEAALSAIDLAKHASATIGRDKAIELYKPVSKLIAICFCGGVFSKINEVKKNESEVDYDDPNM